MKNNLPIVILVKPQLGENIGAVARAMSNFGLKELRLVAPRDGWPNIRARETASGGEFIIDGAVAYPDTASAMADIEVAYATTARPRDIEKRVAEPRVAMRELHEQCAGGRQVALMFGPERTGLENDDITLADTLITIPTAPENSSLNLGQSAVVVLYEWLRAKDGAAPVRPLPEIAPRKEWQELFDQLESHLDEAEHFRVPHKKGIMWQNLKNMLLRGQWSSQELRSFHGMLRSLRGGRRIGSKSSPPPAPKARIKPRG
jgi:tRNA/rRNA methyltransferase